VRALKGDVAALARAVYGSSAEVIARRDVSTWWRVEVFADYQGRRSLMMDATERSLAAAYGDVAVRLRGRREA